MRSTLFYLPVAIFSGLMFVQTKNAEALDSSGYIDAVYDRAIGPLPEGYTVDSAIDMEGRLKLKTKSRNDIRGVFALDASVYDREVIPSRLYFDYKPSKTWRLRIGYAKKIIGLAYEQDKMARLTIHRAAVYDKMNRSGLVGRQLALGLRWRPGGKKRNTLSLAVSHDGSRNTNLTWSAIHRFSMNKGFHAGLWGILELRKFKTVGQLKVFANAAAFWYQRKSARFALEVIHGIDPDATHYEMLFENSRRVQFLGPRLEAAYRYRIKRNVSLQPLFHSSMLFDDLHHPRSNTLQFLVGLNLQIQKIMLSINAETIGHSAPKDIGARRYERKSIHAEAVYYF
ncbi:MAG: hypothetical protein JXX14_13150 [Deltaproteobacteria bacterium]|nr:hypothetical protein [Deltaproteobacteria bacterium]